MRVAVSGRFTANDLASALTVCTDGFGIAQFLELGINELARSERLVDVFPDWAEERFPVYLMT
jgi:DNA-binding transcriptional LysR family regulator